MNTAAYKMYGVLTNGTANILKMISCRSTRNDTEKKDIEKFESLNAVRQKYMLLSVRELHPFEESNRSSKTLRGKEKLYIRRSHFKIPIRNHFDACSPYNCYACRIPITQPFCIIF